MFKFTYIFLVLIAASTISVAQQSSFKCVLVGKVINRPYSQELLLVKEKDDLRIKGVKIPIQDGEFYYELEAEHAETYSLNFTDEYTKGGWRPIMFFAEPDTLYMTLYPMDDFADNKIIGGVLNPQNLEFQNNVESLFGLRTLDKQRDLLMRQGLDVTEEAKKILDQRQEADDEAVRDSLSSVIDDLARNNKILSPQGQELSNEYKKRFVEWIEWKTEQILSHPSLITFRELSVLLQMANAPYDEPLPISVSQLVASYEKDYRPAYPDHPYRYFIDTYLESMDRIKVGGKYIDFTLPDFEGNAVNLSEYTSGKVSLLNFWASWCGPCRRKAIEMIPVYEEFKGKGFEVIGVAREKNKETGINAANMDKYPWLNLLEINDDQNIWRKYGLGNSGGGVFLIDAEGVILAVEPAADEVREILKQRLF